MRQNTIWSFNLEHTPAFESIALALHRLFKLSDWNASSNPWTHHLSGYLLSTSSILRFCNPFVCTAWPVHKFHYATDSQTDRCFWNEFSLKNENTQPEWNQNDRNCFAKWSTRIPCENQSALELYRTNQHAFIRFVYDIFAIVSYLSQFTRNWKSRK